ncbi:hypothetical protein GOP47_0029938 [Adiantum capillus-veneris]|nr:hypothetical protein GOP47_0029938 [Adiantum capillus-veneris]
MENSKLTVRAKFLTSPKSPGVPGILMLNESKFSWKSNDPKAAQNLDVLFRSIKVHRANKETPKFQKALLNMFKDAEMKEGYLFEFDNFKDRDDCRNLVAKVLGKMQTEGGVKHAGEGQLKREHQASSEQNLNKKEADFRMKLLSQDIELQKLHKQLVINGVLSDEDFWAARKRSLNEEAPKSSKQKTGLKTAMLVDIRPMHDGRTNKVTFNLTPEIIHQIFAEKPAVHRAFLAYVPSKMTEVEFWTKYCRADLIHRTQNAASVAAEADEDEHLAMFLKDDDIIASESRKKIRKVDPTVDMTADEADDYLSLPGHGIFRDGSKERITDDVTQIKRTLLRDINRHASVVLDGRILDVEGLRDTMTVANALLSAKEVEAAPKEDETTQEQRRLERVHEMTKVDDLEKSESPPFVPLCIQDPRSYFDSQRPNAEVLGSLSSGPTGKLASTPLNPREVLSVFRRQLTELKAASVTGSVVVPEVATKVLHELTHYISNRKFQVGKHAGNFLDALPRTTKEELLQLSATSHELLRHFWAAFPLTSNTLRDKASRIKGALTQIQNKLQGLLKESEKREYRHPLSQLSQSLTQALDAAILHYENDEKRNMKS